MRRSAVIPEARPASQRQALPLHPTIAQPDLDRFGERTQPVGKPPGRLLLKKRPIVQVGQSTKPSPLIRRGPGPSNARLATANFLDNHFHVDLF